MKRLVGFLLPPAVPKRIAGGGDRNGKL